MSEHYLYPGMLFAEPRPHRVTTVLGSCIAVCLFDPVRRVGGVNHYMLPLWNGEGLPTPRYGNVAIDALVDRLSAFGCQTSRLQAKIFGGAAMWDNSASFISVGERNIDLAWRMLERYGIPVVGSDVGGGVSRKIIVHTGTGEVLLRRQENGAHAGERTGTGRAGGRVSPPVASGEPPAAPGAVPVPGGKQDQASMAKTILAVDDSASIRQLLGSSLTRSGYRVMEAADGREGLEKLAEYGADLIITDLHMPVMDGIGLITAARTLPDSRFVPIIMLTTENQHSLRRAGAAAGATAWLTKPFRPEELMAVIRKVGG